MGAELNASHVPYREWGAVYSVGMGSRKVIMELGALAAMGVAIGGCRLGGSVSTETALNQLRAENAELKTKVAKAEGEAAELRSKLEVRNETTLPRTLPVCVGIEIGGLSSWSKDREHFELLVQTLDGRGRFVPVAAEITVTSEGSPFVPVKLGADAVREAYRSGVMGTYYLVRVPRIQVGKVMKVELVDEVTGKKHEAEWREAK